MRERKLLCIGWLPILGISLALLALTLAFEWRDIERKVKTSASQALASDEFSWAAVETYNNGRDVVITGAAPNKRVIDEAENAAHAAYGVRTATHNGEPLAPPPPAPPAPALQAAEMTVTVAGDKVELRGTLASQADLNTVLSVAKQTFGEDNVVSHLTVGENIKKLASVNYVKALSAARGGLAPINAHLRGNTLSLSGTATDDETRTAIENAVASTFDGNVVNRMDLPAAVGRDICADLVTELLTDRKINFSSGSATISTTSHLLLDHITATAKRCPNAQFQVEGHTDSVGSRDFNIKLSEKRARSVIDYLTSKGLDPSRFSAKGYGPNQPIADNSVAEGRAENRRIEFKLSN